MLNCDCDIWSFCWNNVQSFINPPMAILKPLGWVGEWFMVLVMSRGTVLLNLHVWILVIYCCIPQMALPRGWRSQPTQIDGLMQERRNSIANALELRLSCPNPSRCEVTFLEWSGTNSIVQCWTRFDHHSVLVESIVLFQYEFLQSDHLKSCVEAWAKMTRD